MLNLDEMHNFNGGSSSESYDPAVKIAQIAKVSMMVGLPGFEPGTSRLSGVRSHQLSYKPSLSPLWEKKEKNRMTIK